MFRSNLALKISIGELVERLNDDACVDVIKLVQHELGHDSLNALVKKIIIQFTQTLPNESLAKIEKKIRDKYSQHSTSSAVPAIQSNINNTAAVDYDVIFPLLKLSDDLISKTSLFLNKKDIFQFEQCCRLFYQMINNTSYIKQPMCNNFKTFIITKKRLMEMRNDKYSFFKYSKANQLIVNLHTYNYKNEIENTENNHDPEKCLVDAINDFETTTNKITKMGSYDNWWTSLLKSISILDVGAYTEIGVLLSLMPIEILFHPDPHASNLKQIAVGHAAITKFVKTWDSYMNKFEQEYLQWKKKLEKQGLKIKSLKCIKHCRRSLARSEIAITNPRYIDSKHVWLKGIKVDLTNDKFLTKQSNPGMKILTIDYSSKFVSNDVSNTYDSILIDRGLKIETLRILSCCKFCNDKVVIDSLNLQNSLKNLTIVLYPSRIFHHVNQEKAIENILQKNYYYNLENVNIILENTGGHDDTKIDWFFKLFKDNHKILKYQFKQLNIAIERIVDYDHEKYLYFVLEWNNTMDDKHVDQVKKQFYQMKSNVQNHQQFKAKYLSMKTQWLD